jgi:branched-chain amino acid transport system permease protein
LRNIILADRRISWPPLAAAVLLAGIFAAVLADGGYLVTVLGFAALYGILVVGLNLLMGHAGQISFGQNAFAALGGYGSAILTANYGWEPLSALLVMLVASCIAAVVIGYPTLRLRGHYLAMATFALGLISYEISVQWRDLTQGYMGISGIPPLGIGYVVLETPRQQLVALTIFLFAGIWISIRLRRSRFGRALGAIAGSEDAAAALGIPVARYKMAAFVIAAGYASVAGSLFAHFVGFISPEVFGPAMVLSSFTMIYLGGIGTVWGPLFGAVAVSLLPQAFSGLEELQDLVYCLALILILIFAPKGLVGLAERFAPRRRGA